MSRVYEDERKEELYQQILRSKDRCHSVGASFDLWWKHLKELFTTDPMYEEIVDDIVTAHEAKDYFHWRGYTTIENPFLYESLKEEYGGIIRRYRCPFLNLTGYMRGTLSPYYLGEKLVMKHITDKYNINWDFYEDEDLEEAFVVTKACVLIKKGYSTAEFIFFLDAREFTILKDVFDDKIDENKAERMVERDPYYKLVADEAVSTGMILKMSFDKWFKSYLETMQYFVSLSLTVEDAK